MNFKFEFIDIAAQNHMLKYIFFVIFSPGAYLSLYKETNREKRDRQRKMERETEREREIERERERKREYITY